eukprot:GHUV01041474.1.p1 GENE.GHUV01041474.1~~GHUV01041474.1.p1  ORF type:complete len:136 (-),score=3.56 GHUV01041474.1:277-684(-)
MAEAQTGTFAVKVGVGVAATSVVSMRLHVRFGQPAPSEACVWVYGATFSIVVLPATVQEPAAVAPGLHRCLCALTSLVVGRKPCLRLPHCVSTTLSPGPACRSSHGGSIEGADSAAVSTGSSTLCKVVAAVLHGA